MTTMSMTTAMTTMSMDTGTTASVDTGTTASVDTGTTAVPDTSTTGSDSSDSGDSTDSTGTTSGSESSDSGTTGGSGDCVDEDIGMALGDAVASGSTVGQGDDFDWEECYGVGTGGFDSGIAFIGPGDTFGEDDGGGAPGGGAPGGKSGPGNLGGEGPGDDYVVSWTAPATGVYTLSLEGSSYDTFLTVHDPVCGSEVLECNDDCFDLESGLELTANMGQTYFIVVDGYAGAVGNFTLSITSGATLECEFASDSGDFGESGAFDTGGFIDPTATSGVGSFSTSG